MKKILLIIPLIVSIVLSMFSITANAEAAVEQTYTGLPTYYYDKDELADELYNQRNLQSDDYFFVKVCNTEWFTSDQFRSYYSSYYVIPRSSYNGQSPNIEYTDSDGVYTFTITNGTWSIFHGYSMCYYSTSNPDYRDFRNKSVTPDYASIDSRCHDLVFDTVNNTVTFSNGDTNNLTYGSLYYEILEVDYNINGMTYNPDALNVLVEFHPELVGSIDRSETLPNGVVTYQDLFNFNVINNSRFGIQWCMAIVEQGSSVEFNYFDSHGADSLGTDFVIHTDDIKYIYLYTEDVYLDNTLGFYLSATAHSPMHFVSSQSESGPNLVKWDMVNLDKDHNYDVVVYAVRNDGDKVSFVHGSLMYNATVGAPVYFSDMQEVYRSTFSLVNPAKYDSNSKIGGSIANDSNTDYRSIGNTLYSYTDPDGSVNYGQYDYSYDVRGYSGGSLSYIDNYSSNNSGKFQTLMRNTSAVFGFYAGVLKFFPTDFLSMYQLGIFSLVVIAIIRRLT